MMPDIEAKAIVSVFDAGLKDVACRHAVYGQGFEAALGTPPAIGFVEPGDRPHGLNIALPVAVSCTGLCRAIIVDIAGVARRWISSHALRR